MTDSDLILVILIGTRDANGVDIAIVCLEEDNECGADERKHDEGSTE
jgi:hypothetical protein